MALIISALVQNDERTLIVTGKQRNSNWNIAYKTTDNSMRTTLSSNKINHIFIFYLIIFLLI